MQELPIPDRTKTTHLRLVFKPVPVVRFNGTCKTCFWDYSLTLLPDYVARDEKLEFWPRGGMTEVTVFVGKRKATGVALCSANDNYSKKVGRSIAIDRALKQLTEDDDA